MPGYLIEITDEAEQDLVYYRVFERKAIIDGITTQLQYEPMVVTANRKPLRDNQIAAWELRIGKYRVFYEIEGDSDVREEDHGTVVIISIGHKEHNVLYVRGKVVNL